MPTRRPWSIAQSFYKMHIVNGKSCKRYPNKFNINANKQLGLNGLFVYFVGFYVDRYSFRKIKIVRTIFRQNILEWRNIQSRDNALQTNANRQLLPCELSQAIIRKDSYFNQFSEIAICAFCLILCKLFI